MVITYIQMWLHDSLSEGFLCKKYGRDSLPQFHWMEISILKGGPIRPFTS